MGLSLFAMLANGLFDVQAQQVDTVSAKSGFLDWSVNLAENVLERFSVEKGRHSVAVFPVAGYTPRTGIEYGLMPVWRIEPKEGRTGRYYRPTTLASTLLMSTTGMYEADVDLDAFTGNGLRFSAKCQWLFLPDKFYGVGNQDEGAVPFLFDATKLQLTGNVAKQIGNAWFAGLSVDVGSYDHSPAVGLPTGLGVVGGNGGVVSALGPLLVFDNRDNAAYPTKGWYLQGWGVVSRPWLGSGFAYEQFSFDGRGFLPLGKGVLGAQCQWITSDGEVPFFKMAALGGKRAMRGVPHPLKYNDLHMWLLQGEYRRDLWWRFGAVVFAGCGESFGSYQRVAANVRYTAGVGLRIKALPRENLNFRIDYGIASGGDNALYFTLREAF